MNEKIFVERTDEIDRWHGIINLCIIFTDGYDSGWCDMISMSSI